MNVLHETSIRTSVRSLIRFVQTFHSLHNSSVHQISGRANHFGKGHRDFRSLREPHEKNCVKNNGICFCWPVNEASKNGPKMPGKVMRQRKSSELAPGADLRKDISLENEMYWFKRQFALEAFNPFDHCLSLVLCSKRHRRGQLASSGNWSGQSSQSAAQIVAMLWLLTLIAVPGRAAGQCCRGGPGYPPAYS